MVNHALLVSRSCTTGWFDWVHGDLWVASTALIRFRLDLQQTRQHGARATLDAPRRATDDLPFEPDHALSLHPTNKHIRFDDIATARLRRGIITGRLSLTTISGQRHKLLWLKADPAFDALAEILPSALHERLAIE